MKKSLFLSMMVVLLSLVGCKEETEFLNPSVTVDPDGVSETSLSFKITPEDANSCAYLCIEADAEVPSAEAILETGKPADADAASVQTVENLSASTRYIIIAAVEANGIKVASRTISMTTAPAPSPDANPAVEVTAMEKTSSSFTFEINPKEAVKCSYVCIEGNAKAPEASAIIANGKRVLPNQKSEQIETGLEDNKDYVIVAAVQNGDKYNTAELKFKTTEGNVTEFTGSQAKGRRGVDGNFFVQINNGQKTVALDFYGPQDAETLAAGTYKFAKDKAEYTILSTTSTFGTKDHFTTFVDGEAKVEIEEENYAISFKLIQKDGSEIWGSYNGEIEGMFVEFPSFDRACDLPITKIKANHFGNEAMLTITLGEDQYRISFDMYFPKQESKVIPYGDYKVEDRADMGADATPFITKFANIKDMATGIEDVFQVGEGVVNVSTNDDAQWVITMTDLVTESYLKYNNVYTGPIKGLGEPQPDYIELATDGIYYSLEVTEDKKVMSLSMNGADYSFDGTFKIQVDPSDKYLKPGTYPLGEGINTFQGQWVSIRQNPDEWGTDPVNIKEGSKIIVSLDGEVYHIVCDLQVAFTDYNDSSIELNKAHYRFVYDGKIDNMIQPDMSGETITGGYLDFYEWTPGEPYFSYWDNEAKFYLNFSNGSKLSLYAKFPSTGAAAGSYYIPEGSYTVKTVPWGENGDFTIAPTSSQLSVNEGVQNLAEGGIVEVAYEGGDYVIKLNVETSYGIPLNQQYKGQLTDLIVPGGESEGGDEFVPEKVFTADAVEYSLYLTESGLKEYNLGLFANDYSFNTSIRIRGKKSDAALQAGDYTYGDDGEMTFDITSFSSSESAGIVDNGTLKVELSGETYTITADFILKLTKMNWETWQQELTGEEIPYRVVYTGTINRMFQPDVSDLTITGGYVESNSYGVSYWGDSAKMFLTYSDGSKLSLYLKFPQTNAAEGQNYLPAGTYEVKIVPWGENADFTIEPNSSQFFYGEDLQALLDGTVSISYDGTDYVFNVDVMTAFGIVLNQQYKGQITDLVVPAI